MEREGKLLERRIISDNSTRTVAQGVKLFLLYYITGYESQSSVGQEATFVLGRPQRRQNSTETPGFAFPLTVALPGALLGNLQAAHDHTSTKDEQRE